jgi:hypothetical protein
LYSTENKATITAHTKKNQHIKPRNREKKLGVLLWKRKKGQTQKISAAHMARVWIWDIMRKVRYRLLAR